MITYDDALEIARNRKPNADKCIEYENAFMFTAEEDKNYKGGYGHCAIVISKEDGSFLRVPDFLMANPKEIRETSIGSKFIYVEPENYFPKELREKYFGESEEE